MKGLESINPITQENYKNLYTEGLTKREYFAGLAMQGMLANKDASDFTSFTTAEVAIRYADELLNQLGND